MCLYFFLSVVYVGVNSRPYWEKFFAYFLCAYASVDLSGERSNEKAAH